MPQSISQLYIHTIFSTKNRQRALAYPELRDNLNAYTAGILKTMGCMPIIIGSVIDHMHGLFILKRTLSVADTVGAIKQGTSAWIKQQKREEADPYLVKFAWQAGYAAFSVSPANAEAARSYIANQEEHHRRHGFQEEYRNFLTKNGIEFDERYVWD